MTDLKVLLKKSIIDRDIRDPDDRAAIYAQARRAVLRRLWELDPPIKMEEIDARMANYDRTVAKIEGDLVEHFERAAPRHTAWPGEVADMVAADDAPGEAPVGDDAGVYGDAPAARYDEAGDGRSRERALVPAGTYDEDAGRTYREPAALTYGAYDDPPAADEPAAYGDAGYDEAGYAPDDRDAGYADTVEGDLYDPGGTFPDGQAPYVDEEGSYLAPLGYDSAEDGGQPVLDAYRAPATADRWATPIDNPVAPRTSEAIPRRRQPNPSSYHLQVRLLVGAIVVLLGALGVLGFLLTGDRGGDDTVTVAIENQRQISDAASAVRIAADDLPVQQTFVVFSGSDPTVFESTTNNPVRFDTDTAGNFARVASSAGSAGARVVIGPGLAEQLAGQQVRVRMVLRESAVNGAAAMRFAYQSGVAISHWQTVTLEPGYTEVGIRWRVPALRTSVGGDYIVVEPGIPGDGTGVDIRSVEVDILEAADAAS